MTLYVSVDESYSVRKLNGLKQVVQECASYTHQDGSRVTASSAKAALKSGSFNVYQYDSDDLEEAKSNGYVRGVEWTLKVQAL